MNRSPGSPTILFALVSILVVAAACHSVDRPDAASVGGGNSNAAGGNRNEAVTNPSGAPGATPEEDFKGTAGIVEKRKPGQSLGVLKAVRTASHPNFDRVVFEFEGDAVPGYKLEYVDKPVRQCGSGEAVAVEGDGWLNVTFTPAQAHTEAGQATVEDRERRLNLKILKELESICDFEGEVAWVLGVSSPNVYRVLELAGPARLVVDIKH
ncbi:MAG TPA: hypothetical protein VE262_04630 [Blastocatellia bacterium]|nr:hypothetical protein [Blastocatellia bacterium]